MQTGFSNDINLNGRVTTRVVDGASVDLGNSHDAVCSYLSLKARHKECKMHSWMCQMEILALRSLGLLRGCRLHHTRYPSLPMAFL